MYFLSSDEGELVDSISIQLVQADLFEGSRDNQIIGSCSMQRPSLLAGKRTVDVTVERKVDTGIQRFSGMLQHYFVN